MQSQIKHSVVPVPERHKFVVSKKKLAISIILIWILFIFWGLFWTFLTLQSIKAQHINQASTQAQLAEPVASFFSLITLQKSPEIELWKNTLLLIPQASKLQISTLNYTKLALQNDAKAATQSSVFLTDLKQFDAIFFKTIKSAQKSTVFKKIILPKLPNSIQTNFTNSADLTNKMSAFEIAATELLHGDHRLIILFQNSEELRATGGFMGSYAIVDLSNGVMAPIQFYDIFDADGQIKTEFPAPPGVKEYLSGGRGMRLPNANWNPDFPSSAQDILKFFALAGVRNADGVVAINLTVVEDLLQVTGPVSLPDYQEPVTSENISQLARADRAAYFPGSKQKKNFLRSLSTQLRLTLQELQTKQQLQLAQMTSQEIARKNVQLFFHQPELEQFSQVFRAGGHLSQHLVYSGTVPNNPLASPLFLELVESNVGINKANRNIQRQALIKIDDKTLQLHLVFENFNPISKVVPEIATSSTVIRENPRNDYINYQRILVPVNTNVTSLSQDGKQISGWDEAIVTSAMGEKFKQIGFLLPVPEQTQSALDVQLDIGHSFQLNPTLVIQKQSGLPPTSYSIQFGKQIKNLLLTQDEVVQFTP